MKPLYLTTIALLFFTSLSFAQRNTTPSERYTWDGKSTVPRNGYVILRSGKKMEGMLSIKGSYSEVKVVILISEGKEIEFKPISLSEYGIYFQPLVNDSPDELYEWRSMGETNGHAISNTKPRNGYVILASGVKLEGELQLKKVDGRLDEIRLKNDAGKGKYELSEVNNYGLILTISEITDNGKKERKDFALNFHSATIYNEDGTAKSGFVAFQNSIFPNGFKPLENAHYRGIYYAATREGELSILPSPGIIKIEKKANDSVLTYVPFGDGTFVLEVPGANVMAAKVMQKGSIKFSDGTEAEGELAMMATGSQPEFYTQVRFKASSGIATIYKTDKIESAVQQIDGKPVRYIKIKDFLIQVEFDGAVFAFYRNPYPTTVNKTATSLAKGAANVGSQAAVSEFEKGNGDVDSVINSLSLEQLMEVEKELVKRYGGGSEEKFNESAPDWAKKRRAAVITRIVGMQAAKSVVIYKREWILLNKKTNDKAIVVKDSYKDLIDGYLMGCENYLTLDKKSQSTYKDFDNIFKTLEFLEVCFK
ncbi:MAG: hypothetical protein K1X81_05410 [Bacteroidia bacterium]|nr:hypothetical protein [Bacteroidia bacterium]